MENNELPAYNPREAIRKMLQDMNKYSDYGVPPWLMAFKEVDRYAHIESVYNQRTQSWKFGPNDPLKYVMPDIYGEQVPGANSDEAVEKVEQSPVVPSKNEFMDIPGRLGWSNWLRVPVCTLKQHDALEGTKEFDAIVHVKTWQVIERILDYVLMKSHQMPIGANFDFIGREDVNSAEHSNYTYYQGNFPLCQVIIEVRKRQPDIDPDSSVDVSVYAQANIIFENDSKNWYAKGIF